MYVLYCSGANVVGLLKPLLGFRGCFAGKRHVECDLVVLLAFASSKNIMLFNILLYAMMYGMELLTVDETAHILKLTPATVRRLLREGKLTAIKIGGHQWRIRRSDLEAYLTPPHQSERGSGSRIERNAGRALELARQTEQLAPDHVRLAEEGYKQGIDSEQDVEDARVRAQKAREAAHRAEALDRKTTEET